MNSSAASCMASGYSEFCREPKSMVGQVDIFVDGSLVAVNGESWMATASAMLLRPRLLSRHRRPLLELGPLPGAARENVAKGFARVPDVDLPRMERAEAEA